MKPIPILAALLLSACGNDVHQFEGLWTSTYSSTTSSCSSGTSTSEGGYVIRLRAGSSSDLEVVDLDQTDRTTELCVTRFSVDGDKATLENRQSCDYPSVNADGTTATAHVTYESDVFKVDGDRLHESGATSSTDPVSGACTATYISDYDRL